MGKKKTRIGYIIGIDEVGRGPLAGPVAVGVVKLKVESLKSKVAWERGFKDSKKLTLKAREAWFVKIEQAREGGWLEYAVAFVAPRVIDEKGITHAINMALSRALKNVSGGSTALPRGKGGTSSDSFSDVRVLLDGGLRAPAQYEDQETIIKGDEKEIVIALASIVAKVTRDKYMVRLAKKLPQYGFERHKGYGTRAHYAAIRKHGVTAHHRKSFL